MLHAGFGLRDITPDQPTFLVGYPHVPRVSTGVHDPLYATTMFLEDSGTAVVLVSCDLLFVARETAATCRQAIGTALGVNPAHVLISATHTHSGPVTNTVLAWREDPLVPPPAPEYLEKLQAGIVEAAKAARDAAVPAELAVTTAHADGVGGNRLAADGVRDPEVGILVVRDRQNHTLLGLDMVYSMHPTVMHEDTKLVSSDFPHYTRLHLREMLGDIPVVYHTGTEGNQSPRYSVRGQTFAEAERLGRRLGQFVGDAVRALGAADFATSVRLAAASDLVPLPGRTYPTPAEAEARLAEARATFERLRRENAGHGPVRTAECAVFGAEEVVALARAQADGAVEARRRQCSPAEVQVLRVGDACLVGLPGEVFVEYGLEIKSRAAQRSFVINLANGELQGYIVTPEAERAGGYEASMSMFTAEGGARMVEKALDLIRRRA
ncbi:MAG: hypothetical protein A3K19_20540 [Lentisphaerae bacterium RIFOXYB12_FULL_65_16]|nr:MAG: hypothetical protein A3K18_22130 [Lentisphaerae bacterium RIFOXYA12_64_32]OGV89387.1 MAG: hypothetical protein A3K19_20540 [Lentisphaerae bacterium RIFOXYB12_FULL_65_16]